MKGALLLLFALCDSVKHENMHVTGQKEEMAAKNSLFFLGVCVVKV